MHNVTAWKTASRVGGRWLAAALVLLLAACGGDYSGGAESTAAVADTPAVGQDAVGGGQGAVDGDATPSLSRGKRDYGQYCQSCHGAAGDGGVGPALYGSDCPSCTSMQTLVPRIDTTMPSSNPARCQGQCATDVAAYIRAGFSDEAPAGDGGQAGGGSGGDTGGGSNDGGGDTGGSSGDGGTGGGDSGGDSGGNSGGETPPDNTPDPTCAVTMRYQSSWNTGFVAQVVIDNFSGAAIDGWEVRFTFPNDQRVTNNWNSDLVQTGADVSARNVSYNGLIEDGSSRDFGFQGEHGGANQLPETVELIADGCVTKTQTADNGGGADPDPDPDPGNGDGGDDPVTACAAPAPRTLRLLTRREYERSIVALTGLDEDFAIDFPVEARVAGYDNNARVAVVTSRHIDEYIAAAEAIAEQAVATRRNAMLGCSPSDGCLNDYIDRFGRLAFRRPLTTAERDYYRSLNRDELTGGDFDTAMELVTAAILASPNFLYRSEVGEPASGQGYRLSGYETAAAMAYLLWGAPPDDALLDAAADGDLATPAGRLTQAERLLADTRARAQIDDFARQWMGTYRIAEQFKDTERFPRFDDSVRESMIEEFSRFVNHVFHDSGDGSYQELLTADYVFVDGTLRNFYRLPGSTSDNQFTRQPVPDTTRGGVLSTGSLTASHAHSNESSPIKRGVFVRERLLCQDLPDPPPDVDTTPPGLDPSLTTRERFRRHTDDPNCQSCHQYIDGIGFGFERYDAVGDYRETENEQTVDDSGELVDREGFRTGTNEAFFGPDQLAQLLADSPSAQACAVKQYYRYARGYVEGEPDACTLESLTQSFADGNFKLRQMLLDLIADESFVQRREATQ